MINKLLFLHGLIHKHFQKMVDCRIMTPPTYFLHTLYADSLDCDGH